mgnify:CR=1 FL=1
MYNSLEKTLLKYLDPDEFVLRIYDIPEKNHRLIEVEIFIQVEQQAATLIKNKLKDYADGGQIYLKYRGCHYE